MKPETTSKSIEGESSSPADQFRVFMAKVTQYKAALDDEDTYREIIGRFVTRGPVKSNNVPAESYGACLQALADAVEQSDGPSAGSFESLAEMRKPEVLETIRKLEGVLKLAIAEKVDLRSKHAIQGKLDKANLDVLRPYAAHLTDRADSEDDQEPVEV